MKILNLTASVKAALTEQAGKLSAKLDTIVNGNQGLARLVKQQAEITAEIAQLESGSPDDSAAMQSLGEKRTALGLVNRRIVETPTMDVEGENELKTVVRETDRLIETALEPTFDGYVSEIAAVVKPHCLDAAHARWVVGQMASVQSLAGRTHPRFGSYGAPVPNARLALRIIEEILTGNLNWSFTPKA
jgi:hypothetical protein